MKRLLMTFSLAACIAGFSYANNPDGGPCKDRKGNVVECKHSTKARDSKAEHKLDKAGHKVKKGGKHAGYDATHNKATKETKVNKGNQKYKYNDDI